MLYFLIFFGVNSHFFHPLSPPEQVGMQILHLFYIQLNKTKGLIQIQNFVLRLENFVSSVWIRNAAEQSETERVRVRSRGKFNPQASLHFRSWQHNPVTRSHTHTHTPRHKARGAVMRCRCQTSVANHTTFLAALWHCTSATTAKVECSVNDGVYGKFKL